MIPSFFDNPLIDFLTAFAVRSFAIGIPQEAEATE
jgi:hypothetical protein